ncbi:MAG TPA: alkene reductase [Cytophagales bacterium]|nr:alkene reductase [Cytophagales bacterium]
MKTQTQPSLFEQKSLKGLKLQNSIVMAPMTRSRAIGSIPTDLMISYYAQRASAGLIITEGTSPSANGLGYARTPGIFSEKQIEGWAKISTAVHEKGGKIFMQLMHVGRIGHTENQFPDSKILAPSPIVADGDIWTDKLGMQPHPTPLLMTWEDIDTTIQDFTQAAKNAVEAGFDGIELHGANGYLIEQFLNPHSNQRTDHLGGSVINRSRFLIELTRSVIRAIGKEKVGVRISPYSTFNDMPHYPEIFETYDHLSKTLNKLDIAYLHIVEGAALKQAEGEFLLDQIRNNFSNTIIINGDYNKERAEEALELEVRKRRSDFFWKTFYF